MATMMWWIRQLSIQAQPPQPAYPLLETKDSIRLLQLSPGSENDLITGELIHVTLSQLPDYEALSYTWGSSTESHSLHTPSGAFPITESLQSALKRLRYPDQIRKLWVDALCINQSENEEKSRQIMLMPKIYANATRVVVYLGDEADGSEFIIGLIEQIIRAKLPRNFTWEPFRTQLEKYSLPPAGSYEWIAFETSGVGHGSKEFGSYKNSFWRRTYFSFAANGKNIGNAS